MSRKLLAIALLCSLSIPQLSIAMCKKKKKKTEIQQAKKGTLEGTWTLTYLEGSKIEELYKNKIPSITFDVKNKRVSGNNGCNSFSGPLVQQGNNLSFSGPLATTRMFCEGVGEQQFMDALSKVTSFSFPDADQIDLIRGDIGVMRLQRK